ncbi:MAG: thioredoxin family protein [Hyphomicrobiaceae bacterium]
MRRRELLAASAIILTAIALPTWARAQEGYEPRSFEEALAAGPAVVHVYAGWCPVCRAQKPVLAALAKDPALAGVKFFTVDFDKDRQFLRTYRVGNQSVILLFKNGQEAARLVGITDAETIRARLLGAL